MSEPIPAGTEREDPGVLARKLVRPQDIITELWYEPEEREQGGERSSASGLRTGGKDRLDVEREPKESDEGPGGHPVDDEAGEDDDAAPAKAEEDHGAGESDDDIEREIMEERDAMAGPAVGIFRNPFRYGDEDACVGAEEQIRGICMRPAVSVVAGCRSKRCGDHPGG